MKWIEIKRSLQESSTAGSTSAGNVASSVSGLGVGFDPDGDHGIYDKKTKKKPLVIKR